MKRLMIGEHLLSKKSVIYLFKVDYTSYIMYMDMPPVNTEMGISTEGVHIT